MPPTIGYLGPEGTFTHQACLVYQMKQGFSSLIFKPYPTISAVLNAAARGGIEGGIVPAENSIEGSVNVTLDTLAREDSLYIRGELVLDITHHLVSYASTLREIDTVLGHPQAIAQCRGFLEKNLPQAVISETNSSAEAVSLLSSHTNQRWGAISTPYCEKIYDPPVIVRDIGDYKKNQTRFFLVGTESSPSPEAVKTSLLFALKENKPGSLYKVLGELAQRGINLSKIESRPAKNVLGSYLFFVDCEAGYNHRGLQEALPGLLKKTAFIKNLGTYPDLSIRPEKAKGYQAPGVSARAMSRFLNKTFSAPEQIRDGLRQSREMSWR